MGNNIGGAATAAPPSPSTVPPLEQQRHMATTDCSELPVTQSPNGQPPHGAKRCGSRDCPRDIVKAQVTHFGAVVRAHPILTFKLAQRSALDGSTTRPKTMVPTTAIGKSPALAS